jgi:hypothetical protein
MAKVGVIFDRIANIALLGAVLLFGYVAWNRDASTAAPRPVTVAVGTKVANLDGVDYSRGPTLLLVLSSTCRYCHESLPFYRQLVAEREGFQVIAGSAESPETFSSYLRAANLSVDKAVKMEKSAWQGVSATPTLLVIDSNGRVSAAWVGLLSDEQQAEVREAVRIGASD